MAFPPPLFAVHLNDGWLQPNVYGLAWIGGGYAGAALLVFLAGRHVRPDDVPKIGLLSAAFFVSSLIHFPIGGVASAHLILNGLLGVILGRRAPLAVAVGITLQAFLFQHGGWTTIGLNTLIVALPALAAGAVYPRLHRLSPGRVGLLGGMLGTGTALGSVALNAAVLGFAGEPAYFALAGVVVVSNLPFALAEGLATGCIVAYLAKVKPEWLTQSSTGNTPSNGTSH